MADPITREQVERAIAKPRCIDYRELPRGWREWAPDYVIAAEADDDWDADDWDAEHAALTRWRDELAAAEPAEDSPERLRERREALGKDDGWIEHILDGLDVGVGAHKGDGGNGRNRRMVAEGDPDGCDSSYDSDEMEEIRAAYAAALSAEEERRGAQLLADEEARAEAFHAEPERPAPRFKVGDWVRSTVSGEAFEVTGVSVVGESVMPTLGAVYASARCGSWSECYLEPASPPATEVVDVPQPIVKRCACPDVHDDVDAEWRPGEPYLTVTHTTVPLALLRAMLEAIDAQQQPDPQPDLAEGWRVVTGDTAFAMPFGTIRECSGCGCLVSGGPTACRRCADAQQGGAS